MIDTLASWKDAAPIIGAAIAATSALVALIVFNYTRRVNRRRATLDMVLKTFMDDAGRERYKRFKKLMERHRDPVDAFDILLLADPASPVTDEREILRAQINEYELIALGIRRGLFDEGMYKLWFQHQFMRDFESLEAFIRLVRAKRPSVFCEFVWLYTRWKTAPHPENAPGRLRLAWWAITDNQARLKAFTARSQD